MPTNNPSATILIELLRPAVRFALRRGIKVRAMIEELKNLLVQEANAELAENAESPTASKLAVMTGLQRRDVQRLSSFMSEPAQHLDLMTRIVGAWCTNDAFTRSSKPKDLSIEGADSEFNALVRSISKDINPATALFELERLRLVERSESRVKLLWNSYQISGDIDDAYLLLQRDIFALVEGVDTNIKQKNQVPNLHISTRFDNISVQAVPEIREWVLKRGAAFHAEVREFIGGFDKDINPSRYAERGGVTLTVGSFSLCEVPEDSDAKR